MIKSKSAEKSIARSVKRAGNKVRSKTASAINKEIRACRKEITEEVMAKTGLKRKSVNDRISISRASPSKLKAKITPLYGRILFMTEYPWAKNVVAGGKQIIRLLSPLYNKNMRTGFLTKDGKRLFLKPDASARGSAGQLVASVKGRTIPRLFEELKIKDRYESTISSRVLKAIRNALK